MKYNFLHHRDKEPFENIKKGIKNLEIRLYDDKRRKIKIGDVIKVVSREDGNDFLFVRVTKLDRFESFNKLYNIFGTKIKGYEKEILARVYSKEQEKEYGVLVIHFELLK